MSLPKSILVCVICDRALPRDAFDERPARKNGKPHGKKAGCRECLAPELVAARLRWTRADPIERFWSKVEKTESCWLWVGSLFDNGYGSFWYEGRSVGAHRFAYELLIGPIPEGLHLDHVYANGCRHKNCVNQAHLEPVTPKVNTQRMAALITHCPHGHPYDDANTHLKPMGWRRCRECGRIERRAYLARHREENHSAPI